MTKEEAIQIANEYMKKESGFSYKLIHAGKHDNAGRPIWSVSYQYIFPEGITMEPGSTILIVDVETGEVSVIPLM